jgi:hypothetical protein
MQEKYAIVRKQETGFANLPCWNTDLPNTSTLSGSDSVKWLSFCADLNSVLAIRAKGGMLFLEVHPMSSAILVTNQYSVV